MHATRRGNSMKGALIPEVVAAMILLIIAVAFYAGFLFTEGDEGTTEEKEELEGCRTDDDCLSNLDGSKCLLVYPEGYTLVCGCIMNDDCNGKRSGFCGSENKCV